MTSPEHSPLPWIYEPDDAELGFGIVRDANGEVVQIYGHGMEIRARIVTAVNSHAPLLAAAKRIVSNDAHSASDWAVIDDLNSAIAKAEEPAPLWTE